MVNRWQVEKQHTFLAKYSHYVKCSHIDAKELEDKRECILV